MSSERLLLGQRTVRLRLSGRKKRSVQMLHTENMKLEQNLQKNIFPKVSSRTRMYNQLIKQSNSIAKLCKDINES
jgi:hypothetical protein